MSKGKIIIKKSSRRFFGLRQLTDSRRPCICRLLKNIVCLFLMMFALGVSQLYSQTPGEKWDSKGYIKFMQSINFVEGFDSLWVDNLFHNRLNFNWYPENNLRVTAEIRNRIFYGDLVRLIPNYGDLVDVYNDYFDLSVNLVNQSDLVIHSMIDRLYFQWTRNKFELTAGRQRINWGINLAWNPNDIFNAYSFFDFDYEERPGTDGLRLQYHTGFASSFEVAANMTGHIEEWTAGALWKFNRWNYDLQVLGGIMEGDVVLGGGWSGNISGAGFRGEFSHFLPFQDSDWNSNVISAVAALDYMFPSTLYLYGSYLYNNGREMGSSLIDLGFTGERLSAKNLMPFRHSLFLQGQYTFHPLLNGRMAVMYFPVTNGGFFLNPNLSWSLAENWDLDLVGQIYYANLNNRIQALAKYLFWRVRWSF
jgi:hypothetical protein